jgi:type II secretory pathway component PulJ
MKVFAKNAGLTLAELLIALVISALVLVLLAQGTRNLSRWTDGLDRSRQVLQTRESLLRFVQERLSRAEPLTLLVEDEQQVLFRGGESQLRMVVAETTYPAIPGLYEQVLDIYQDSTKNWNLSLTRMPLHRLDEFGSRKTDDPLILYTGSERPVFAYLGKEGWQKNWAQATEMPRLVSFQIENWPTLQIALPPAIAPWSGENATSPDAGDTPDAS